MCSRRVANKAADIANGIGIWANKKCVYVFTCSRVYVGLLYSEPQKRR